MSLGSKTKVLLIGWDAADWKIINPLLRGGKMHVLAGLMKNGVHGTIESLEPPLSPMLWTSISTGKTASQHGILGFIEPDPETAEPRPASVTSRNCKAIWNILNQNNFKSNVIGWWPSHPAEPLNGLYVSNMFTKNNEGSPLIHDTVYPPEASSAIENCRVYPDRITLSQLRSFVPEADLVDQQRDKHLHNLASLIAGCQSIFNAAIHALSNTDWNLTAVYFDTIDQCSHTFMKFYPPQMDGVPDEFYKLYYNVLSEMYCFHDMLLGRLITAAGENTNVILLSDHGFYSDHLRPVRLPNDPASPALEHSAFGILCAAGPQINNSKVLHGANLLDLAPTILNLFGISAARDMEGIELKDFLKNKPLPRIHSWDSTSGPDGMHSPEKLSNSWHSTAAMFQMMELGYIENFPQDKSLTLKKILQESEFYKAINLMSESFYEDALPLLLAIYDEKNPTFRFAVKLAACHQFLDQNKEAEQIIRNVLVKNRREVICPEVYEAIIYSRKGKNEEALSIFLLLLKKIKHLPSLFLMTGNEYLALKQYDSAENYYRKALALNEQYVPALSNLVKLLKVEGKDDPEIVTRLNLLSKKEKTFYKNTVENFNNMDFNPDQKIDFRKYQLIIRLFLEQFHKGAKMIEGN